MPRKKATTDDSCVLSVEGELPQTINDSCLVGKFPPTDGSCVSSVEEFGPRQPQQQQQESLTTTRVKKIEYISVRHNNHLKRKASLSFLDNRPRKKCNYDNVEWIPDQKSKAVINLEEDPAENDVYEQKDLIVGDDDDDGNSSLGEEDDSLFSSSTLNNDSREVQNTCLEDPDSDDDESSSNELNNTQFRILPKWQISLKPLLLSLNELVDLFSSRGGGVEIPEGSGCLLHLTFPPDIISIPGINFWSNWEIWRPKIFQDLNFDPIWQDFLAEPMDTFRDIEDATTLVQRQCVFPHSSSSEKITVDSNNTPPTTAFYEHKEFYGAVQDFLWWQSRKGLLPLKDMTKLRRILLPLLICVASGDKKKLLCIRKLEFSLADWIIEDGKNRSKLRSNFITTLLRTLQLMKQINYSQVAPMDDIVHYLEIQHLIIDTLQRAGGQFTFEGKNLQLDQLKMIQDIPRPKNNCEINNMRRIYSHNRAAELLEMEVERKVLMDKENVEPNELQKRQRVFCIQARDGTTEFSFLKETSFMHRVNATFARRFDLVDSRPRFAQVQLNDHELRQLATVLFDEDTGTLRPCTAQDASRTGRNYYISFCNDSGAGAHDKRWQIPLNSHVEEVVPTRAKIEEILFRAGVLDPQQEKVTEIVLLIGGTEDQSIHHDLPRDWVTWKLHVEHPNETIGWENNRLRYNRAMISKHAPAGLILPIVGGNHKKDASQTEANNNDSDSNDDDNMDYILIGVQKDQIVKSIDKPNYGHVRWGDPNEEFEIVRETIHLAVLKVWKGCIFTGDFPHAGVCNVTKSEKLVALFESFRTEVDEILTIHAMNHFQATNAVLETCCRFRGLNQLCRLYIATQKMNCILDVPPNAIGYYKCYSNEPSICVQQNSDPIENKGS